MSASRKRRRVPAPAIILQLPIAQLNQARVHLAEATDYLAIVFAPVSASRVTAALDSLSCHLHAAASHLHEALRLAPTPAIQRRVAAELGRYDAIRYQAGYAVVSQSKPVAIAGVVYLPPRRWLTALLGVTPANDTAS